MWKSVLDCRPLEVMAIVWSMKGMALQGLVFKKLQLTAIYKCDISCEREISCPSYNYVIGEKS